MKGTVVSAGRAKQALNDAKPAITGKGTITARIDAENTKGNGTGHRTGREHPMEYKDPDEMIRKRAEFQKRNPMHRPGVQRPGLYRPCLIKQIALDLKEGWCGSDCPACTQHAALQALFDHEEEWHVHYHDRNRALRLGLPYLDQEDAAIQVLEVLTKLPFDSGILLSGHVGPDDDSWYEGPYTSPVIIQAQDAPAPIGWTTVTVDGITQGERQSRLKKRPPRIRHHRTLVEYEGKQVIEARDEYQKQYLGILVNGSEPRYLMVELAPHVMDMAISKGEDLRETILGSAPRHRYMTLGTPEQAGEPVAMEAYWGPILEDDVLPDAGFRLSADDAAD